jgi:type II secretory pathway predicted ATPase ExeA
LGRPELDINLRDVPDFNDRVATRSSLDPLPPEDTKALIEYRLLAAGRSQGQGELFTDGAARLIWQETRGYPRSICLLCVHICLEFLDQTESSKIDEDFVERFLVKQRHYRKLEEEKENA